MLIPNHKRPAIPGPVGLWRIVEGQASAPDYLDEAELAVGMGRTHLEIYTWTSGNQPTRKAVVADALVAGGVRNHATIMLCAHEVHRVIWPESSPGGARVKARRVGARDCPSFG